MVNRFFDYPVDDGSGETAAPPAELGLLDGAGEAEWSLLFDYGERRTVVSGETIIERGALGRSLIIVLAGQFRIMAPERRRGRTAVVAVIGPGDVVGEVGFAAGGARSNTVIAAETGEIFEFEWEALQRLAAAHPALGVRILSDVLHIVAIRIRASAP